MTLFQNQSAFDTVNAAGAHTTADGYGQVIAIIDVGFDLTHEGIDLQRVTASFDFRDGDFDVSEAPDGIDQDGEDGADSMLSHGTAVASLLMELAPGATFVLIRCMDEEGTGTVEDLVDAIVYARLQGATVINLSLEAPDDPALHGAIQDCDAVGITVVAPSGNDGNTKVCFPGAYAETLCVASVNESDRLEPTANNGPLVDIMAPGEGVLVAAWGLVDKHGTGRGTSYATAFVSAAAALIREGDPTISFDHLRTTLRASAKPIPLSATEALENKCGLRLDMQAAVE